MATVEEMLVLSEAHVRQRLPSVTATLFTDATPEETSGAVEDAYVRWETLCVQNALFHGLDDERIDDRKKHARAQLDIAVSVPGEWVSFELQYPEFEFDVSLKRVARNHSIVPHHLM